MSLTFGALLRQLRKRAAMSQHDLGAATGYSRSLIGALEQGQRLPDLDAVMHTVIPALHLGDEPQLAAQLLALAAAARGERLPQPWPDPLTHADLLAGSSARPAEERYQLPLPPADLIGREGEIERVQRRLAEHPGRLLTLIGPPGVGKTRLAQAAGAQLQWSYRHGACFVSLAPLNDSALVASHLLMALKLQDASAKSSEMRVIEYLRRKELLLILDNFEQILDAAPFITELLAQCGGLHVVVTSRERLHLRAEQRYHVQPLALQAAIDLFCRRAATVDSSFMPGPPERATVAAICRCLDCLPLALELCAAQIDLLTPAQLLAHLREKPLDLLVEGAHDLPPAQRTLRAAIQYSYELLDEDERRLLRSLSVLAGGGDLAAVRGISGSSYEPPARPLLPTLHALINKNLVQVAAPKDGEQGGERRFSLLETIRQFGLEQARAAGEEDALHRRHYTTYLRFARQADRQLWGAEAAAWFARFDAEQDNVRAAQRWALAQGHYVAAASLAIVASRYWSMRGRGLDTEALDWFAQLLEHRQALGTDLRLAVLLWWCAHCYEREPLHALETYAREVLALSEACSVTLLRAAALHWLALAADPLQANTLYQHSVDLARLAGEQSEPEPIWGLLGDHLHILAENIRWYARYLVSQGKTEAAEALAAEALELHSARGSQLGKSEALGILGQVALLRADVPKAAALLQAAAAIQIAVRGPAWLSEWRSLLGTTALYSGDSDKARRWLKECLVLWIDQKQYVLAAGACVGLADMALHEGKLDDAQQWLAQSLAYRASRSHSVQDVEFLSIAGRLAVQQGSYRRAAVCFGAAEALSDGMEYHYVGPMRPLVDRALTYLRAAMCSAELDGGWTQGRNLALAPQTTLADLWPSP